MRSAVLQAHLLSLNGTAVPDAFLDVVISSTEKINIPRSKVADAVNIICPPAVFDAYAHEYMQRDDVLTSATFQNSLTRFVGILRDVLHHAPGNLHFDGKEDSSIAAPQRYTVPNFTPRTNLAGTKLPEKSNFSEKMHAIDLIIDNPDMLIAYAALDAMLCDYFKEGYAAWYNDAVLMKRHPAIGFVKARNAFATLDYITNQTHAPSLGMVHGLLTQTYFRHLCNCLHDGRPAGQWEKRDVVESIAAFYPSQMFTGEKQGEKPPAVCPMQRTYIIAALGFAHRQNVQGDARLWTIMRRAATHDAPRDYVREQLGLYFKNTLRLIIQEQPFIRPTAQPN